MRFGHRLLAVLILTACASSPKVSYYTLSAESSGTANPVVNLEVLRFHTTEALSRHQIMISVSPTRVEYYASDQWVGGIGELVQRKLQTEFGALEEGRPTYEISGTVVRFEQVDLPGGAEARMVLDVVVRDPHKKRFEAPLLERTFSATEPSPARTADSVAAALSVCSEEIAAEIVKAISSL